MRVFSTAVIAFGIFTAIGFQGNRQRPATPPREEYDPTKLGPGEVACGHERDKSNDCKCIQHRLRASETAQLECYKIENKTERAKCMVSNEVCNIVPRDAEHPEYDSEGNQMPAECKRTCRKARCLCCKS